jgi:hypothetical protein
MVSVLERRPMLPEIAKKGRVLDDWNGFREKLWLFI